MFEISEGNRVRWCSVEEVCGVSFSVLEGVNLSKVGSNVFSLLGGVWGIVFNFCREG